MKRRYLFQFILIFLGSLLYFTANVQRVSVPGSIFDVLQRDLMTNPASITALGASFMYLYAFSQLLMGFFISKYGGYRVLSIGAIIFVIGSLLFPFSKTLGLLYLSRALVGLGSSTFYLSIIHELKNISSQKNFGLIVSFCLIIGYLGSILAAAPLVLCVNEIGWRNLFIILGIITTIIAILFLLFKFAIPKQKPDKTIKLNFDLYKNILFKKENIYLYIFGCINYALYFILQTVIGKKFLEDFTQIHTIKAALILSIMATIYAISGPTLATLSRIFLTRKAVFLKIASLNTLLSMLIIAICVGLNIKTLLIPVIFCSLSFFACLTPLLVPLAYDISEGNEGSISMSIMTSMFFFIVAILSNIIGYILNSFEKIALSDGTLIYSNTAYFTIFIVMAVLAVVSVYCCFKIQDTKVTRRLLFHKKYIAGNN